MNAARVVLFSFPPLMARLFSLSRYWLLMAALIPPATLTAMSSLVGCGGGGGSTSVATPSPTASPSRFPGVHEYLNLDLDNIPNYAHPAYPAYYADAMVLDNTPSDNPVTDRGATLGRVLFFDRRLSRNDSISCASCHEQYSGFTDDRRFSIGFDGQTFTTARAMRLNNLRFYAGKAMFWDKRAASLEAQANEPLHDRVEMGFDDAHGGLAALRGKMETLPYYPELFRWTYGDPAITQERIDKALAQFERSLVSVDSRFDSEYAKVYDPAQPFQGMAKPFAGFSERQERGKQLFLADTRHGGAGCASCHVPPTFALAADARSNGLDAGETRVFKTSSLKNVAWSGSFMHDARFTTLEEVVDHYINGVQEGPALDSRLRNAQGNPQRLALTQADRDALVAFLKTLNDPEMNVDAKFANPFIK